MSAPADLPADDGQDDPTRALDVDGVKAVAIGTGLWAVAFLVMLGFRDSLAEDGRSWWIATAAVGVALGLAGLVYVRRRRAAILRSGTTED